MNVGSMSRSLRQLTVGIAEGDDWPDVMVGGLSLDSRSVVAGDLFLAVPGRETDGRRYIDQSLAAGAVAVLCEPPAPVTAHDPQRPVFEVANLSRNLGTIADRFYDQPSRKLCVIGITGTNGKTTCSHLLAQALAQLGAEAGVLGTVGNGRPGALRPSTLTTADAVSVHRELRALLDDGVRFVCMEVSSHALDMGRVDKVAFDYALFTNLSQDHLDYHGDMASYGAAKARLFRMPDMQACVINVDDEFGRALAADTDPPRLWSYGESEDARVRRVALEAGDRMLSMQVVFDGKRIAMETPLSGRFNADNAMAVYTTLLAMGFDPARAAAALRCVSAAPGRMERFEAPASCCVYVDYAHTPDALEKALEACRQQTRGQLWVVFGCGGDRDRGKRAPMGEIAARLADHVILTNDNPRGEEPMAIIEEIRRGGDGSETVIPDRRQAIAHAIEAAGPGDVVLVAGKGHETGQTESGVVRPFSDRQCVCELLGGKS